MILMLKEPMYESIISFVEIYINVNDVGGGLEVGGGWGGGNIPQSETTAETIKFIRATNQFS